MPAAPNPKNLMLGAGELLFNRFDADGLPTGFVHMGNVETFELTTTDDRIVKNSSMSKARPVYAERTRSRVVALRCLCDEHHAENMALMLMGSIATYSQLATPVVDEELIAAAAPGVSAGALLGGFYKAANYKIDTVTMKAGATALTAGVDFVVHNATMGTIQILPDAVDVAAGDQLLISYTPEVITDAKRIRGGTESKIEGAVMFVPDPSEGILEAVQVWRVSVSPDGAVGLISNEFSQFALNMTVQDDSAGLYGGTADEPLYTFTELGTAE